VVCFAAAAHIARDNNMHGSSKKSLLAGLRPGVRPHGNARDERKYEHNIT
jgi:hypothetical protein